eukprot:gene3936-2798_t
MSGFSSVNTELLRLEVAEAQQLLETATFDGIKAILQGHVARLERQIHHAENPEGTRSIPSTAPSSLVPTPTSSAKVHSHSHSGKPLGLTFHSIESFAWDQGPYNTPSVSVFVDLDDVGTVKDNVRVVFTKTGFDLTVEGLNGKNYRLFKDNLEKDIVPEQSTFVVKKNKVVVKLQKVKGEYSYDHWTNLTSKKKREEVEEKKKDPMGGIMELMKDMYEDGDENMKKIIGEAMMKSQRGEQVTPDNLGV